MKTGTSSLLPRDETRGEKHPAQSQQTKMPTLLLFKKTPPRKTSELGEAIIVTTERSRFPILTSKYVRKHTVHCLETLDSEDQSSHLSLNLERYVRLS